MTAMAAVEVPAEAPDPNALGEVHFILFPKLALELRRMIVCLLQRHDWPFPGCEKLEK